VSQAVCVNNCNELGKVARVEAQKLAKLMKLGYEMRVQLSKKGKELKQEKKVSSRWN
jgi:succinylglutamate desuccinylase